MQHTFALTLAQNMQHVSCIVNNVMVNSPGTIYAVTVPALVNALAYRGGTVLGVGQAVHLAPV